MCSMNLNIDSESSDSHREPPDTPPSQHESLACRACGWSGVIVHGLVRPGDWFGRELARFAILTILLSTLNKVPVDWRQHQLR